MNDPTGSELPLLILGASGRTGRLLVAQCLAAGHPVRAMVRTPSKLQVTHPRLQVVTGDVLDASTLEPAVRGTRAVLSTLGRDGKDVRPIVEGTRLLVAAMQKASVSRLVCMTSLGAGSTASHSGLLLKAIISLSGLKPSFEAKAVQERALHHSGLDVTLVFAGGLTDGQRTGAQRATPVEAMGPVTWMPPRISRADVADFMLTELREGAFRGQSVCVFG